MRTYYIPIDQSIDRHNMNLNNMKDGNWPSFSSEEKAFEHAGQNPRHSALIITLDAEFRDLEDEAAIRDSLHAMAYYSGSSKITYVLTAEQIEALNLSKINAAEIQRTVKGQAETPKSAAAKLLLTVGGSKGILLKKNGDVRGVVKVGDGKYAAFPMLPRIKAHPVDRPRVAGGGVYSAAPSAAYSSATPGIAPSPAPSQPPLQPQTPASAWLDIPYLFTI